MQPPGLSYRVYDIVYPASGLCGVNFFGRNVVFDYIMTYKSARELRAYHSAYLAFVFTDYAVTLVIVVLKFDNPCDCIFLS